MRDEMTELSRINFDEATSGLKTVREAVDFLEENARIRTFREKLEKFYAGDDLRKIIHIEQMVLPDAGGMNMLKKMKLTLKWIPVNPSIHVTLSSINS